jgi:hypothetical protein
MALRALRKIRKLNPKGESFRSPSGLILEHLPKPISVWDILVGTKRSLSV